MSACKSITIIGGGLAGLALGIGLRQRKIPVTIWEAGRYPRHRVCGEFISGRGQDVLGRLGLSGLLAGAGAIGARTAMFYLGRRGSPVQQLQPPAFCLSRFQMDGLLASHFRECGGELLENQRWREPYLDEGVVRATGRRLANHNEGCPWFGLKVHARNVPMAADLEMHGFREGYVGLARLPGGKINVCGLFRSLKAPRRVVTTPTGGVTLASREIKDGAVEGGVVGTLRPTLGDGAVGTRRPTIELLRGPVDSPLYTRLGAAEFEPDSFCAVAGFSLEPRSALTPPECCIGDALTMIPPVTGNGMSMALEAAALAIEPLVAYSGGELSWAEAQQSVARACDRRFARRLAWARWLQRLIFAPVMRTSLGKPVLGSRFVWDWMFSRTR